MPTPGTETLLRLLDQEEDRIDLGRAALLLAHLEYPELDVDAETGRLDVLAAEAESVVSIQPEPGRLAALRFFLSETCGFKGNDEDYYDPKNSFLNEVLDRRTGIPITLSVVYIEVGRRLGLPLFGVGLPGHFVVKHQEGGRMQFIDPFHGGRCLSAADCRRMVDEMYQGRIQFREDFLAAVTKKYILVRMLNNLRNIYFHQRQYRKALIMVDTAIALEPGSTEDLKQRGLLHYQLRNYRQARLDLEVCVSRNPQAPDAEELRQILQELKRRSAMLN
jgi:regulator of sirC expression with transglutaminase-like and TPR domain